MCDALVLLGAVTAADVGEDAWRCLCADDVRDMCCTGVIVLTAFASFASTLELLAVDTRCAPCAADMMCVVSLAPASACVSPARLALRAMTADAPLVAPCCAPASCS